jgi:quercetin dioxygenase-like cupin family protein
MKPRTIIASLSLVVITAVLAQEHSTAPGPTHGQAVHTPDKIQWKAGPPSLPPGAKMAVLEGDPTKEGPFTMRALLPDGYSVPPHTHPAIEHVTVISGTFNFGMGEKFDKSATQAMPAGSFGHWPPGMKHFAWADGETIIQIHGLGPWGIQYVNPADDPRNKK